MAAGISALGWFAIAATAVTSAYSADQSRKAAHAQMDAARLRKKRTPARQPRPRPPRRWRPTPAGPTPSAAAGRALSAWATPPTAQPPTCWAAQCRLLQSARRRQHARRPTTRAALAPTASRPGCQLARNASIRRGGSPKRRRRGHLPAQLMAANIAHLHRRLRAWWNFAAHMNPSGAIASTTRSPCGVWPAGRRPMDASQAMERKAKLLHSAATDACRTLAAAVVSGATPSSSVWALLSVSGSDPGRPVAR